MHLSSWPFRIAAYLLIASSLVGAQSSNGLPAPQPPNDPAAQRQWEILANHRALDAAASVLDPENVATVEATYDAVFTIFHLLRLPTSGVSFIRSRVVSAEINYWSGKTKGVSEKDIADALNEASDKLNLPEYAKTSETQVRAARFHLLRSSPIFIGKRFGHQDERTGAFKVSQTMSPLQALHTMQSLIDMKLLTDPSFLVTPAEWEESLKHPKAPQVANPNPRYVLGGLSPKAIALERGLGTGFNKMSDLDGLALINRPLKHLGVS